MLESLLLFWLEGQIDKNLKSELKPDFSVSEIQEKVQEEKDFDGKSSLIFDLKSGTEVWSFEAEKKLPMASLTKLMTALLILENHDLDEEVTVTKEAVYTEGAKVYFLQNEVFSVEELLNGLLIRSGNDCAVALAIHDSGTTENFVKKMNQRAAQLGLKNTQFKNPTGMDAALHYSTAKDLALLTTFVLKNEKVREIVKKKMGTIYSKNGRKVSFYSTNQLLGGDVKGVKTGTTENAGQCLITLIERDGKDLLFVLLGSRSRFDTTEDLINFVFRKI